MTGTICTTPLKLGVTKHRPRTRSRIAWIGSILLLSARLGRVAAVLIGGNGPSLPSGRRDSAVVPLVAWSFGDDRHDLWNIGAPMALAGQAAFLIGLVLQLDILWQESKQTGQRLQDLDQRVAPMASPTGASSMSSERGVSLRATSSESTPARDAESLLKELKGQLDRMATRLTRYRD